MSLWRKALAPPKAAVGSGVWSVENLPQLSEMLGQRNQQKIMHDAQTLFHTHPWVGTAERTIVGAFLRLPWHLETPDGESVDADMRRADPRLAAVWELFERPSKESPYNTRRKLWSVSLRHQGLCGMAFWFLDQRDLLAGTPLEILYINPARLESITDEAGNLLGWLMDGPQNPVTGRAGHPGVPLQRDEIIPIPLDPPDTGHFGIGIPESARRKIELSRLADHHIAQLLSSGGKLAGIMAPKQGAEMSPDQWDAVVKGWRQITNDADSAKRLHIVKGPVDFTATTMRPADMELNDLARMGREDIFGIWGVPPSQRGITEARGLNSGETQKYEEAALYQGAVQERGDTFIEAIQIGLLDRFKVLGIDLKLVVEWPSFDDQQPLFENASKARIVPLSVDDRRDMVGRDPLDPAVYGDLGKAIFIDKQMVRVDPFAPEPEPTLNTPPNPAMSEQEGEEAIEAGAKAALDSMHGVGERLRKVTEPLLRTAVAGLLRKQRDAIARLVEERAELIARKPNDHTAWWLPSRWDWADEVAPVVETLANQTVSEVERGLQRAKPKATLEFTDAIRSYLAGHLLDRARNIDTTTRQAIAEIVNAGVAEGLGPAELGARVRDATAFNEARAEMIARTETAIAQNAASLRTYTDFGVAQVQAIDGDEDAECAARNGAIFSINEASAITDHPNGTLDWIPVVDLAPAKARLPDVAMGNGIHIHLPESIAASFDIPTPQVTVNVPDFPTIPVPVVNVPAPIVNLPEFPAFPEIPAPVVNLPAPPKAELPAEVRVVSLPDRAHKVIRNRKDEVTGSVETDA